MPQSMLPPGLKKGLGIGCAVALILVAIGFMTKSGDQDQPQHPASAPQPDVEQTFFFCTWSQALDNATVEIPIPGDPEGHVISFYPHAGDCVRAISSIPLKPGTAFVMHARLVTS